MAQQRRKSGRSRTGDTSKSRPRADRVRGVRDACGNEAVKVNRREDRGSRSTTGQNPDERRAGEDTANPQAEPPRGPLPEGATEEDYVGGEKPHETRESSGTEGGNGRRNDVV